LTKAADPFHVKAGIMLYSFFTPHSSAIYYLSSRLEIGRRRAAEKRILAK
jgi:hypothetical protein